MNGIDVYLHAVLYRNESKSASIEQNFRVSGDQWIRLATLEHFHLANTRYREIERVYGD